MCPQLHKLPSPESHVFLLNSTDGIQECEWEKVGVVCAKAGFRESCSLPSYLRDAEGDIDPATSLP